MDISQIETKLTSQDFQDRLDAVTALKDYSADVAIPLLIKLKKDQQFLVRSFVAMGLGRKKSPESLATLLEMLKFDADTNVRAEASNSLSFFGEISIPHLQQAFHQDDSWLVRLSILAVFMDFKCPDELFDICLCGIAGDDYTVKETSIRGLGELTSTFKEDSALVELLKMVDDSSWRIRAKVALALGNFSDPKARDALSKLKQDQDIRVVKAVLDATINN
ncbi:HEAT repeat domain-containing protein [Geminocystis sp. NIES-3709]|uniref:HEAT repeat domain-containing protein n=1 Tax=Geminocystis sp. NIES-3709 TaxID=1617448 RepID=UPI0005FC5A81|nr:HEAT repeat domain-containing protein [Geminocystis sp. NIES-3709]BAQ64638.1 phycocyanin alpha phycocyanobilin lyase related protein NblB [Geminocystis sp. NIES-3709]